MSEASRLREAFDTELTFNRDVAPGPTALNRRLGRTTHMNRLNGRMNALRKKLLTEAGFVQDAKWGRWYRDWYHD